MAPGDGRAARRPVTHDAILRATRVLMQRGVLQPSGATISDLAHVSVRSIHQHFTSMTGLYLAAVDDDATARAICERLPLSDERALAACFVTCRLPGRSAE